MLRAGRQSFAGDLHSDVLGSACVSRAGFGVTPKRTFRTFPTRFWDLGAQEKSAMARTPSPARETRALPNHLRVTIGVAHEFASVHSAVAPYLADRVSAAELDVAAAWDAASVWL
jgi:hypothetical protein